MITKVPPPPHQHLSQFVSFIFQMMVVSGYHACTCLLFPVQLLSYWHKEVWWRVSICASYVVIVDMGPHLQGLDMLFAATRCVSLSPLIHVLVFKRCFIILLSTIKKAMQRFLKYIPSRCN